MHVKDEADPLQVLVVEKLRSFVVSRSLNLEQTQDGEERETVFVHVWPADIWMPMLLPVPLRKEAGRK